jgi:hypothetical protein
MTDDTIIDASSAFANKAGKTEKAGKAGKSHGASQGINFKPSQAQKRDTVSAILPGLKEERAKRAKLGRPYSYSRDKVERICQLMAEGKTTVEAMAIEQLSPSTFYDWLEKANGDSTEALLCRTMFARARVALADHAFSEALDVPRELYAKAMAQEPGNPGIDSATVGAAKLLADSLKWYAEKLNPGSYASKVEAPTVNVTNNSLTIDSRSLDAGQRDQLRTLLLSTSKAPVIDG